MLISDFPRAFGPSAREKFIRRFISVMRMDADGRGGVGDSRRQLHKKVELTRGQFLFRLFSRGPIGGKRRENLLQLNNRESGHRDSR